MAALVAAVAMVVAAAEAAIGIVGAAGEAAVVVDLCSSMMMWAARDGLACEVLGRGTEGTKRRLMG